MNLVFNKTGLEIKTAIAKRMYELQVRLDRRNLVLAEFMADAVKVRSYLIRSSQSNWGHDGRTSSMYGANVISSEEQQEMAQLCQRIFEIEQELQRLNLIAVHLTDAQNFELDFSELVAYGFDEVL